MRRRVTWLLLVFVQSFLGFDFLGLPGTLLKTPPGKLLLLLVFFREFVVTTEDDLGTSDEELAILEAKLRETVHFGNVRLLGLRHSLRGLRYGRWWLVPGIVKRERFDIL